MHGRSKSFMTFCNRVALTTVLIFCPAALPLAGVHSQSSKTRALSNGTWGGDHILLEVNNHGADAEFDCAHGQITKPIKLDRKGNFDLPGTFAPEHGGPILNDESSNAAKARYTGHIDGKTMTLTIALEKEKLGPFTLVSGQQSNLMKCR